MIARVWLGVANSNRADEYHQHLLQDTFPNMQTLRGFVAGTVLRRTVDEGTEFLVITQWDSLDSIRAFAGRDVERAVVPSSAQTMMVRYDAEVRHYEVLSISATQPEA